MLKPISHHAGSLPAQDPDEEPAGLAVWPGGHLRDAGCAVLVVASLLCFMFAAIAVVGRVLEAHH